jgi:5'(3')-deoxyribonucleotidase
MKINTKQTIAIDMDEVLAPFVSDMILWHNHKFDTHLQLNQFKSYNFTEVLGGTYAEALAISDEFHLSRQPYKIKPLTGAKEALSQLKSHYQLILVTSRPLQHQDYIEKWINYHLPNIFNHIILCNHWTQNEIAIKKSTVCQQYGADYLIDDLPQYVDDVTHCGITGLLFGHYPWNQINNQDEENQKFPKAYLRVKDWKDVIDFFINLNKSNLSKPKPF